MVTLLAAGCMAAGTAVHAGPTGTPVAVTQNADQFRQGHGRPLLVGADVIVGDSIRTGPTGNAQLLFVDNTRIAVGSRSVLNVEQALFRPAGTAESLGVAVTHGFLRFVSGRSDSRAYSVQTPVMTLGVRGTSFDLSVEPDGPTWIALIEGEVEICPTAEGAGCASLRGNCSVVGIDADGRFVVPDNRADRDALLRQRFGFIASQEGLREEFRSRVEYCDVSPGVTVIRQDGPGPTPLPPDAPDRGPTAPGPDAGADAAGPDPTQIRAAPPTAGPWWQPSQLRGWQPLPEGWWRLSPDAWLPPDADRRSLPGTGAPPAPGDAAGEARDTGPGAAPGAGPWSVLTGLPGTEPRQRSGAQAGGDPRATGPANPGPLRREGREGPGAPGRAGAGAGTGAGSEDGPAAAGAAGLPWEAAWARVLPGGVPTLLIEATTRLALYRDPATRPDRPENAVPLGPTAGRGGADLSGGPAARGDRLAALGARWGAPAQPGLAPGSWGLPADDPRALVRPGAGTPPPLSLGRSLQPPLRAQLPATEPWPGLHPAGTRPPLVRRTGGRPQSPASSGPLSRADDPPAPAPIPPIPLPAGVWLLLSGLGLLAAAGAARGRRPS